MLEPELIDEAFASTVKMVYAKFYEAYTEALGDAEGEAKAEATFRKGILHARHVKALALANLPR